jgi:hypothetical protein
MEFDGGAEDSDGPLLVLVTEALVIRETLQYTKKKLFGSKNKENFLHTTLVSVIRYRQSG